MVVRPESGAASHTHEGKTYYFCSRHCLEKFRAESAKYLAGAKEEFGEHAPQAPSAHAAHSVAEKERPKARGLYTCPMDPEVKQESPGSCPKCGMALELEPAAPATKTEYVCPMHPEVVQDKPGACPKCGMALEARTLTLEEEENPELVDMRRRFWASLA
ncbi:MAG: heavy metal-binding domain-containing protein, partial [Terriglobia bacterium]